MRRSVAAGAALVCFSGDKLLGGPQAGLIVGRARRDRARQARIRWRARCGSTSSALAALEATLRLYRDPAAARREIPVLAMLCAGEAELAARAERLAALIPGAEVRRRDGAGGRRGAAAARAARAGGRGARRRRRTASRRGCGRATPPVVGRIEAGRLLLDPRTLADDEVEPAGRAVAAAL